VHFGLLPKSARPKMMMGTHQAHPKSESLAKNDVFRLKSVFCDFSKAPAAKNGVSTMKIFCKQFIVCLVRVENISATPPPEGAFFDQLKFRPKLIFGRKSGFSPFCHLCAPKSAAFHETIFGPKCSRSALFFTKNFEKCLERVLAPKWHS